MQADDSVPVEIQVLVIEEAVQALVVVDQEVQNLRRSSRPRRSPLSDDYLVYLDKGDIVDPVTFSEASSCSQSKMWLDAMSEEIKFMSSNDVWELSELSKGQKVVGCKLVFKTKKELNENVE